MSELNISNVFKVLKLKLKSLILIIVLLDVILLAYTFIMPQLFTSELSIMPPKNSSSGGGLSSFLQNLGGGALSIGGIGEADQSKLFGDILKSKTVTKQIVEKLQLDTLDNFSEFSELALVNTVSNMIEVKVEKSGLLKLKGSFATPYLATEDEIKFAKKLVKELTNSFAEALDFTLKEKNNSAAKQSRMYIENEIKKYRIKLDSVSMNLQMFQEKNNNLEIEEQTKAVVSQAIDIGSQLIKYENELNLAKLQMNSNSNHVSVLQKQIANIKIQAERIQNGGINEDKFSIPLSKVPALTREYLEIFRDREILEKVLMYLETQKHQEEIQEEKDVPIIEVLDYAYEPETKSAPQRTLMMIIGTIFISIFSIVLILFLAYKKGSLIID